jgi:hypothetical protein
MAEAIRAALAQDLDLPDGYIVEWAAIDPASGADVAGVIVTGVSIFGTMLGTGPGGGSIASGPYMLVPGPGA